MENVIAVGGGLMGSSVAWKPVDRGANVTLIGQQDQSYLNGSSYGKARISRSLGPKKDVFSYAHNQTIKEVTKLIDFLNGDSTNKEHSIDDIYSSSPVSYLYPRDQYNEIKKLRYKKQKNDFNSASQRSAFRKFRMSIPDNSIIVREKRQYSGTLNLEELIKKLRSGIERKNGKIKYGDKVIKLVKNDGAFQVDILNTKTQETQSLKANKVIVAAGPYINKVLKEYAPYLNRILTPKKVVLSFLKITDERYDQLTESEKNALFNGFPYFSQIGNEYCAMLSNGEKSKSPIFKTRAHQRRRNIHDLGNVWTEMPQKKEIKWLKKQFRKHLKMFKIQLSKNDIEEVFSNSSVNLYPRRPKHGHLF